MRDMSEIRRNIRSVEETRQVTNAMFLLSTSRMKHAMQQIGHALPCMKFWHICRKTTILLCDTAKKRTPVLLIW